MARQGPGNLIVLEFLIAQLGVSVILLGVPEDLMGVHRALLGLLALLATVVQLATVALLKLEAPVRRAYAPDSGCLGAA